MIDPTGTQVSLARGEVEATVTEVAASLRRLTVAGVDVIASYPSGIPAPGASGIVLVPWPNRVRDGLWSLRGASQQLSITEPKHGNASHGLLRFAPYEIEATDDAATLRATIFPQAGYPFCLQTAVTYELTDDGITVTHVVANAGGDEAPVALGTHPYLTIGDATDDDLALTISGSRWFHLDDRKLPVEDLPIDDDHDYRGGKAIAGVDLDCAFTDLERDGNGIASATLTHRDGRSVTLWQDDQFDYVQGFINRSYPGRAVAVAVEPMTAPADALNSGRGLRWLAPGEELRAQWGITARVA